MTLRALLLAALLALPACDGADAPAQQAAAAAVIPLTVTAGGTVHRFRVEVARTAAQQQKGMMFRPALGPDAGMLFAPYPAEGGGSRVASFWMKDTPHPLDIVFIRPDRTIAGIAENVPAFSQAPVSSEEPVSAVLELRGGRAAELGLGPGDAVAW